MIIIIYKYIVVPGGTLLLLVLSNSIDKPSLLNKDRLCLAVLYKIKK